MRSLAGALAALLGLASLVAVLYAFLTLLPLMADVFTYRRLDHYAPATFETEWVRMGDETAPEAVGHVGAKREVVFLGGLLPHPPRDLNELQDMMVGRERIDIYYDPGARGTSFEGRRLRAIPAPPEGDLRALITGRITHSLLRGYLPAIVLTLLGVLISRLGKGLGCWLYPSVFFLACQPVFMAFILIIEFLT
jgi:hypothetical protein